MPINHQAVTAGFLLNSPNNPTGMDLRPIRARSDICGDAGQTGNLVIADDVYERLYFRGTCAGFIFGTIRKEAVGIDLSAANSLSKAWRMKGRGGRDGRCWPADSSWADLRGNYSNYQPLPCAIVRARSSAKTVALAPREKRKVSGHGRPAFKVNNLGYTSCCRRIDGCRTRITTAARRYVYAFSAFVGLRDSLSFL